MKELAAALARLREVLTSLLLEAAVPPPDAETLLLDVLAEIEEQGAAPADSELLRRVDAACAGYAARRQRPYQGLRKRAAAQPPARLPLTIARNKRRRRR